MPIFSQSFRLDQLQSAYAGSIVYPPGGRYGPRIQQDLQLVMLYTGEMTVTIDGRPLHVQPGHVVLLKPGHEESFIFSKTEETWHRWISVHVGALPEEMKHALYQLPETLPLTEEMNKLADLMLGLLRHVPSNNAAILSLGLAAIHLYPTETSRLLQQREKHPALHAARTWIHEHYADEISLHPLADHAGVSPEHLIRLFKQHEQTTPMQFVWSYRVNRAVELLTNTGLTVSEIAERCGFKTSHHFARLIKQHKGRTASEIRQVSWNG
ncbi:AraC family transcriptional regulator [Paenibacillus guangzhouensis]|uniref:AraC family transcriptional regulator n=1 Tax=Paenibacillus guangzhouensis TaxID=1473112 RepID=UPI001266AC78|nr:AraC family transcriptional regulator [Paenibacillus guangzhouensis]